MDIRILTINIMIGETVLGLTIDEIKKLKKELDKILDSPELLNQRLTSGYVNPDGTLTATAHK